MFGFIVDKAADATITSQLTKQIRDVILRGKIETGGKMPPTRALARDLGISRNTVIQAYEQLIAEGYLRSARGSGTFAADIGNLPVSRPPRPSAAPRTAEPPQPEDVIRFYAGTPDLSAFPRAAWAKALKDAFLDADASAFGYGDPRGMPALTDALAGYLYRAKGIDCGQDRIFIVPGSATALELTARLAYREGGCAAVEDPGITFARAAIARSGLEILPVEADDFGMRTSRLPEDADIRLVSVSPSHQYPLGGVLPVGRRLRLLAFAQKKDAYIIEDDYDSEFRYSGEPIQSLWNLGSERTVYLGSFSNTFYPSLRIAYMVLPRRLAGRMAALMGAMNTAVGAAEQLALARFLESGQMERHIYRMKRLYDSKRKLLLRCLRSAFGSHLKISGEMAGLHVVAALDRNLTAEDGRAFAACRVQPDFVEEYAIVKGRHPGKLVLGFGNLNPAQIQEGVRRLQTALRP